MKNILIVNGHPEMKSLCTELALSYLKGAEAAGATCSIIHLCQLDFDPLRHHHLKSNNLYEPDLQKVQDEIRKADHLVFVYPNWWGTYPALFKGFIDRVFLPGFAFNYRKKSFHCDKLLSGKSARVIVTMNSPKWYYYLRYGQSGHISMRRNILGFCGIKPVRISSIGPVKIAREYRIRGWLRKVELLGRKMK